MFEGKNSGIRKVSQNTPAVRAVIEQKTRQITNLANSMATRRKAEPWMGGKRRARGYIFRRQAAEAADGAMVKALKASKK